MKNTLFTLLLCLTSQLCISQVESRSIFTNGDRILIHMATDSDYYYNHRVEKGHTVYTLSKIFNVTPEEIYQENGLQKDSPISLGQYLKIPIKDDYLYKATSLRNITDGHFLPVYYKAKSKDNLYRIAKVYFNQPVGDLVQRNNITGNSISVDQNIIIGWLPLNPKFKLETTTNETSELKTNTTEAIPSANANTDLNNSDIMTITSETDSSTLTEQYPEGFNVSLLGSITYTPNLKEIKKNQVAVWDNSIPDNGSVYALHESAVTGSYISVYNPLVKRSVRAKVIGRIPYGTYTSDVKLVLSPRAAKQLGGIDRRFKVEVQALIRE